MDQRSDDVSETMVYLNSESLLQEYGLPASYLYTFISADEPKRIIGYGSGHTFRTEDTPVLEQGLHHYRIIQTNGVESGLFAATDEQAIGMLEVMFDMDLVDRMEKEWTVRRIVWASRA